MKFIEKNYPSILIFMVAIYIAILVKVDCHGQTYTFSQKNGKAINIGTVTVSDPFTVSFNFTRDDSTHYYPTGGVIFCEFGGARIYMKYPLMYFVTTYNDGGVIKESTASFDMTGYYGYSRMMDKKQHRLTFKKSATTKEFILDSVLIGRASTVPQNPINTTIWLGSNRIDFKLSGNINTFVYSPLFVILPIEVKMPVGTIDSLEYPLGYIPLSNNWTPVPNPVDQLRLMPTPVFHANSTIEYNSLCVELKYLAGYNPAVLNNYAQIALNGKTLATDLALKFRCGFRAASNLNSFYSDYTRGDFCMDCAIMDTAAYYPNIVKDIGSALVQTNNITPYIAAELDQATITTPLSYFSGTRSIFRIQCDTLKKVLLYKDIPVDGLRFFEDREGLPMFGGLNGTNVFNGDYNYMLDDGLSVFPNLKKTGYDIYSMWFWNEGGLVWPTVLNMTNTNRGTISIYTEAQWAWNTKTGGNIRGGMFYDFSKYAEIATGNPTNTPFVSPGWSATVENNTQPSNWCGMLGIYLVQGVDYFYPAYFTTGGNVQDPKSYAYIPAMPSYVQAAVSNPKYWNVIKNGVLLNGTTGAVGDYNQWSRRVNVKTVAKKLGTEYIIATTNQKENVYEYLQSRRYEFQCTIDGHLLNLFARPQATIFYYDSSKKIDNTNPKMISGNIKRGHPTRWVTTNALD